MNETKAKSINKKATKHSYKFLENMYLFFPTTGGQISYIYFIACNIDKHKEWRNRVKIGYSRDPKKRLEELQIGNPVKLSMLYFFPVNEFQAKRLEGELHRKFKFLNVGGEWFEIRWAIREWVDNHKEMTKRKING